MKKKEERKMEIRCEESKEGLPDLVRIKEVETAAIVLEMSEQELTIWKNGKWSSESVKCA